VDPPSSAPPSPSQSSPRPWRPEWRRLAGDLSGGGGRGRFVVAAAGVVAAVAVVAVVAVALLRAPRGPAPQLTLPQAGGAAAADPGPAPPTSPLTTTMVTVHVAGAVAHPGVYAVAAGARVADVVTAAGGPLPEAEVDRLNLAARVADGDRVLVPRKGEQSPDAAPPANGGSGGAVAGAGAGAGDGAGGAGGGAGAGGTPTSTGPLDLNTATLDQLDTLPGVGPATAQAIVTYRSRHGRFRSVTELLEVPGIGPAKLEAVRPLVKV
jgi:competence protein ComEA